MKFLYTSKEIAVILKPVGLDAEQEVPAVIVAEIGGDVFPVHRLDKNVGGCMVYARTPRAAAALSRAVQEGTMKKEYVALVHGTPPERGDWQDLLWKDSGKNKVFVVRRERKGVKAARLEFTCLRPGEISLVRILLHTGRSHQIRVQFASRGYPPGRRPQIRCPGRLHRPPALFLRPYLPLKRPDNALRGAAGVGGIIFRFLQNPRI